MAQLNADNRQFGRRRALIHAFAVNERGNRTTCLVRNISVGGALLEFEEPLLIPQRFKLVVEADGFEANCDVKHRTKHGVGVFFEEIRIAHSGRDTRFAGPKLEGSMSTVMIGDIGRR